MPEFGQFALRLGLLLSGYAILVDLVGRRWKRRELRASGRNATIGCLLCLTAACVALEILLARSDFSVRYVAVFFFLVLIFDKDPFGLSVTTPRDGAGLNPLLQHPAMVLHPPALFPMIRSKAKAFG